MKLEEKSRGQKMGLSAGERLACAEKEAFDFLWCLELWGGAKASLQYGCPGFVQKCLKKVCSFCFFFHTTMGQNKTQKSLNTEVPRQGPARFPVEPRTAEQVHIPSSCCCADKPESTHVSTAAPPAPAM